MISFKEYLLEEKKLIAYHYTHSTHFEHFEKNCHFGRIRAAFHMFFNEKEKKGLPRIYKVEILNPNFFRLTYEEEEDTATLYRACNVEGKYPELWKAWKHNDYKNYMNEYQAMQSLGYNGVVYHNTYDDKGYDSYIVFDPKDIKILEIIQGTKLKRLLSDYYGEDIKLWRKVK
jgi:hypothetical protein